MNYPMNRRNNLLRDFKSDGIDTFLVSNATNVQYLTGFTGSSSALILNAKSIILVSDSRYEEQIKQECPELDLHIRPHTKTLNEAICEVLAKVGGKSVGIEAEHVTLTMLEALKENAPKQTFVNQSNKVESLRVVKDPSEIEAIRNAVLVAERAFKMFTALIRENDTEKELADAMEMYLRRSGALRSSFPVIVAVGERGALPHAPPTNRPVSEGSKILVDWGADLGYKSDITRTMKSPFPAPPIRKTKGERIGQSFENVYEAVKAAHDAAVAELRAGVKAKEVDAAARKALSKHSTRGVDLAECFTHGLGHGIGLETHEFPFIRQNTEAVLEVGNVVTIEPGVYMPDWGGVRIEDMYLVTKDGSKRLTTLPHDPMAIG
jgi:Xaa-Pro aminopeptidase